MRFSAVQEETFGIGLGQEHIASDAGEDMMPATGEVLPDGRTMVDESSTTYNLPLLFASGYPTSLDKITQTELERFITFMVQCCSDPLSAGPVEAPQWWPKEVKFSYPFVRPKKVNENWTSSLKTLVYSCYKYHKSEYLLRFCAALAQYPREKLYYVNNWDSTTSLYHRSTGKLLATFRNENMEYDKVIDSSRRSLLSSNRATSKTTNKTKAKTKDRKRRVEDDSSLVVIQPKLEEIYLCDNCDAEFGNLEQMKDHEKICGERALQTDLKSRPLTPDEPIIEPELNQNQFLDYFKLSTGDALRESRRLRPASEVPSPTVYCEPSRSSRRMRTAVNLTGCPTIPLSSPAGLIMVKKSKPMTDDVQRERLDRIERNLAAPLLNKYNRPKWMDRVVEYNRWPVTYKPHKTNTDKPVQDNNYVHKYTFGARRWKPELSLKSQILYVACGLSYVKLDRLTDAELEDLKNNPWKYHPPEPRKIHPRPRPRPSISKILPKMITEPCSSPPKKTNSTDITPAKRKTAGPLHSAKRRNSGRQSEPAKTIVLVDLCSSDEEDDTKSRRQCDENRDPMSTSLDNNSSKNNGISRTSTSVYRSRSFGHQGATASDFLRQDNQNRVNYIGNVIDTSKFINVIRTSP